jgi:alpha-L-arabinofuranosidase
MNKIRFFSLVSAFLFGGSLLAQEPAIIKIDPDRKIGAIDPNLYGSFLESPRMGLYEPDSRFADENGFRKDLIALIKELNVPVIRWPGGNFVSGYNWEDGIGPKDKRPARLDIAWNRIETNQMGTDEYVRFCKEIGAENFICINAGTGTLDDARHWVEYCNYPKGTYYSDLRIKNGNEQPFKVKYWALGNEIDGPWQLGNKNKEDYVKFASEAAKMMSLVDKEIKIVASGSSNYPLVTAKYDPRDGWIDWNDYILDHMVGSIDYISLHRYATQALRGLKDPQSFANVMSLSCEIDKLIDVTQGLIEKAMAKSGSKRQVYISFDEYSAGRGGLTSTLMLALHLNSFIRHADIVKMANITFLTALVGNSPDGDFKNTLFYPFYLYSKNSLGTSLDVFTNCEKYKTELFSDIPYLDVSASLNDSTKSIVVNVINKNEVKAIATDIVLQSGEYTGSAKAYEINGATLTSTNTKIKEEVKIESRDVRFRGNTIRYSFPAHSLTQIIIPFN